MISNMSTLSSMSPLGVNKYANAYREALKEAPQNRSLNVSVAMCYLKLNLYDKALPAFEIAIEDNFENAEPLFWAAICLMKGRKAFLQSRSTIDKILEYLDAALMIEPKGIYYYYAAYVKYDYFQRKFYATSPDYKEYLLLAKQAGVTAHDITQLFEMLHVEKPSCF